MIKEYLYRIRKVIQNTSTFTFILYCSVILLLRIPPFYFFFIKSALLTSHSIARYLLIILILITLFYKNKTKVVYSTTFIVVIVLAYFFVQTLSIIHANNLGSFISVYKNLLTAILVFILGLEILVTEKRIKIIIYIILGSVVFNLLFQAIMIFNLGNLSSYINFIFYEGYLHVLHINFGRARYFVDMYDYALIPLCFYAIFTLKQKIFKIVTIGIIIGISLFAFLSNFRSQIVILLLSFGSSLFLMTAKGKKLFFSIFICIIVLYSALYFNFGDNENTLDRIFSPISSDYASIEGRLNLWNKALQMGLASPFFGVGLGNYYDNLQLNTNLTIFIDEWKNKLPEISLIDSHNIFFQTLAETGFLGLMVFLCLLLFFCVYDIKHFRNDILFQALCLSFWSVFIYSWFNPAINLQYLTLLWLLRAMTFMSSYSKGKVDR